MESYHIIEAVIVVTVAAIVYGVLSCILKWYVINKVRDESGHDFSNNHGVCHNCGESLIWSHHYKTKCQKIPTNKEK